MADLRDGYHEGVNQMVLANQPFGKKSSMMTKASLDNSWLRDESIVDSDNLPPADVKAQEIVEDLEAALEQFRLIAADLASPDSNKSRN